jgi:hypothetical protein
MYMMVHTSYFGADAAFYSKEYCQQGTDGSENFPFDAGFR